MHDSDEAAMPFGNKSADEITEADLQELVDNKVGERKTIEFKLSLPGASDTERREYLADVSSFANALGGDLIYGIKEDQGVAVGLPGLANENPDQAIRRLEEMARDGIRPAIPGIHSHAVQLANGNIAIVVRVPRSWNPPHQVVFQKTFRFYGRASNGKNLLDVDELRSIFALSEGLNEKMRSFRVERLAKVLAGDTPAGELTPGARIVMHFLPLSAFAAGAAVDLKAVERDPAPLVDFVGGFDLARYNIDGYVALYWDRNREDRVDRYVQLFRNGCIEVVHAFADDWKADGGSVPLLGCENIEESLLMGVQGCKRFLALLGIGPPVAFLVTVTGVKGWAIGLPPGTGYVRFNSFDRDQVLVPDTLLTTFSNADEEDARPAIAAIWNAAGMPAPHS